uniref:ShKT domain-containing protein n=1 Tax=Haemonchus contortus TaxID=6289 RepID=A0A7I4YWF2_HAECO
MRAILFLLCILVVVASQTKKCEDYKGDGFSCSDAKAFCTSKSYLIQKMMKFACPKTCGLC